MSTPNSSETSAEKWESVVANYRSLGKHQDYLRPMLELVRWLADSSYAETVAPSLSSHCSLSLAATDGLRASHPIWSVCVFCYTSELQMIYRRREPGGAYLNFQRSYATDEIRPALEAWLMRLQMEAEVFGLEERG